MNLATVVSQAYNFFVSSSHHSELKKKSDEYLLRLQNVRVAFLDLNITNPSVEILAATIQSYIENLDQLKRCGYDIMYRKRLTEESNKLEKSIKHFFYNCDYLIEKKKSKN